MSLRYEMARREVQRLEAKVQGAREEMRRATSYPDYSSVQARFNTLLDRLTKARIEEARWRP